MSKSIFGHLQTKTKAKLLQQWVDQAGLPPEEAESELLSDKSAREDKGDNNIAPEKVPQDKTWISVDRGVVRIPLRHVFVGLSIIALLLITLSVVCTILIVQSP